MKEITYPPAPPGEVRDMLDLVEAQTARVSLVAERAGLGTLLDLPAEHQATFARVLSLAKGQIADAERAGAALLRLRVPIDDEVLKLARWWIARRRILDSTMFSTLPPEDADLVALYRSFVDALINQIPAEWFDPASGFNG